MKLNIYSIRDSKVGAFHNPFFSHSDATAVRSLKAALQSDGPMSVSPDDYALYKLGVFCDESGLIVSEPVPAHVENVSALLKSDYYSEK